MFPALLGLAASLFLISTAHADTGLKKASFAMGCFWCAEHDFQKVEGVADVVSGYEGGSRETATYDQVSKGTTDHYEAVEVTYDPAKVSYDKLLQVFWDNIDPFDGEGQFCDKGKQYSAVIFVGDKSEREAAEKSLAALQGRHPGQQVKVRIEEARPFYAAEAKHQDFADNNKMHYRLYRAGCNRDERLEELKK